MSHLAQSQAGIVDSPITSSASIVAPCIRQRPQVSVPGEPPDQLMAGLVDELGMHRVVLAEEAEHRGPIAGRGGVREKYASTQAAC